MSDPKENFTPDSNFEAKLDPAEPGASDLEALQIALQDTHERYLRTLAEFQNYQRRALQNEQVAKREGMKSVSNTIVNVIDHFDLALNQDTSKVSAEQIVSGVRIIRDELMRSLAQHGVAVIFPAKNDLFEPGKHAAVMHQIADGVEPNHVVMCMAAGYMFQDQVLRPAKVSVAPAE